MGPADAVKAHFAELSARLEAGAAPGRDGIELGRDRAVALDRILGGVWAEASAGASCALALAAVGSYGRGAVALRSDADVRILAASSGRARDEAARVAELLLYPLWDAGLSVGHQVVSCDELVSLAETDLATATTLLDMRHLGGDEELVATTVQRAYDRLFAPWALADLVDRLEAEVSARHARFGDSLYLLEPEVKAGAGGLRDLDVARWAARARYRTRDAGGGDWTALLKLGVLVERETRELAAAEELLWRIRNRLHANAGRKSDRLTFDQQETIAVELGYGSLDGAVERAAAAERLMQDYYLQARAVTRARETLLMRARPESRKGRRTEVALPGRLRLFDGRVTLSPADLAEDPALALRAYSVCAHRGAALLPFAREAIARAAADPEWAARLRASPEAARTFVELVCTVREVPSKRGSMVAELHDVGLLLAMIPEFLPVNARVHHDVYHVYTVDVHSVAAVDCLRAACRGELAHERPLMSRLAAEIARPEPLFLATLLHDVGKGYPDATGSRRNHSVSGAEMCDVILPRLGLSPEDTAEARALVLEHLTMYHTATRRDVDDPTTSAEICKRVRGREGLRNLYLLTVADISTTSPTAMTSWKARMLDELYFAADAHLAGQRAKSFDAEKLAALRARAVEVWNGPPADLDAFLESMPDRYLLANKPTAICTHARAAFDREAEGEIVKSTLVPATHAEFAEVCVVADDAPGLLAKIAAALTSNRLEVLAAQVYSRAAPGRAEAVDVFWVRDSAGGVEGVHTAMPRLQRDLHDVCSGAITASALVADRIGTVSPWRERPSPPVPVELAVDNRASPRHTVVEVFAKDRPGLLYHLASALHALDLSIALSKINTEGTRVADVFYVAELDGSKVESPDRLNAIRSALRAKLTEMDP